MNSTGDQTKQAPCNATRNPSKRTPWDELARLTKTPFSTIRLPQRVFRCTICAGGHPHPVLAEYRSQRSSNTLGGPTSHARTEQTTMTIKSNEPDRDKSTYEIGLHILQADRCEHSPSHQLHLLEVPPSRRVFRHLTFDAVQKNAGIIRVTRSNCTY